jgi:phospholipid/cholesterol/gamma-HCH transport system permease protein
MMRENSSSMPSHSPGSLSLQQGTPSSLLLISGDWTLPHYASLEEQITLHHNQLNDNVLINWDEIGTLDTAGATLIIELIGPARLLQLTENNSSLSAERLALLQCVARALEAMADKEPVPKNSIINDLLARVGKTAEQIGKQQIDLLGFIGLTVETLIKTLLRPRRWRITSLVSHIEQTGFNAIPIIALLTFLVGAVVAFLGATVLTDFGASIYTVNLVAFAFLREFGVLLTAILMAGRTASAFTAQIGSMKANEEIDAIRALGLNPIELLVLPRVLAMLISLPILTFIAMCCGMLGGAVVCSLTLDISPTLFLTILQRDISLNHFLVGIGKAPVFAFIVAVIGCLEGFKVGGSAQSVGEHTISSVVQSIFMVIVLDALAALFFMEMSW